MTVVAFYAWQFTLRSYDLGTRSISITETALWIPQLSMCVDITPLGWHLLLETGQIVRRIKTRLFPL